MIKLILQLFKNFNMPKQQWFLIENEAAYKKAA